MGVSLLEANVILEIPLYEMDIVAAIALEMPQDRGSRPDLCSDLTALLSSCLVKPLGLRGIFAVPHRRQDHGICRFRPTKDTMGTVPKRLDRMKENIVGISTFKIKSTMTTPGVKSRRQEERIPWGQNDHWGVLFSSFHGKPTRQSKSVEHKTYHESKHRPNASRNIF